MRGGMFEENKSAAGRLKKEPLLEEEKSKHSEFTPEGAFREGSNRIAELKSSQGSIPTRKSKKNLHSKAMRPAEKIRIDTLQDLSKLSFTQIKSLQIWNLEGKLFQQAFEDALHVKKDDKLIKHTINSIEFQINYKADFGSTVCILGSCESLGNWNPTAAYKMHWSEGHVWRAWIKLSNLPNEFNYKYAVQDSSTFATRRWEGGANRSFELTSIEEYLSSPQNAYSVRMSGSYKFEIGTLHLIYIREREHLIIVDNWQT